MIFQFPKSVQSRRATVLMVLSVSLFSLVLFSLPAHSFMNPIGSCGYLLALKFQDFFPSEEQKYLGIAGKKIFTLSDIQGTVFVIEVFSTYCTTCPRDVPVINEVYSSVKNDPGLRENVRIFSIAIGNNRTEAENYKKEQKILYPVLTDYDFAAHKALGNPRVPYTLILRKTVKGRCIIEYSHQGVLTSADLILDELKSCVP